MKRRNRSLLTAGLCSMLLLAAAKEPKTVITGDQMEIQKNGKVVIFTGNSQVRRGDSILKSDRLVQDKEQKRVEAEGNIAFNTYTTEKELVQGWAQKATYSPDSGRGEMYSGRPEIWYHQKTSSSPVKIIADAIQFDQVKQEYFARGNVEILTSSGSAFAPLALFTQKEKKLTLTGTKPQPRLVYPGEGKNNVYQADKITMYVDTKKVYLDGNVHGTMYMPKKAQQQKP